MCYCAPLLHGKNKKLVPWPLVMGGLLAIAAALRIAGALNDLWLDEIWTLALLSDLARPIEILGLRHDNNHILNSLLAWWLRDASHDIVLRVPAIAAGVTAVALSAVFARDGDPVASRDRSSPGLRAALAALLQGTSYLMVHYQSEARGYPLALAIGLVSPLAFARARGDPRSRLAILHWVASGLALLGHATAFHILAATAAWSVVRFRSDGLTGLSLLRAVAWWHFVPLAATAALEVGFWGRMFIGGGPQWSPLQVVGRVVAYTFGIPLSLGTAALIGAGIALVAGGIVLLSRLGSDQWAFYLVGIAVSPTATFLLQHGTLQFERYYFIPAALALQLTARVLACLLAGARASRLAAAMATTLFLAGQAPRLERLMTEGRGQYRPALAYIVHQTPSRPIRVATDDRFGTALVVAHHARRLGLGQVVIVPVLDTPAADWYIVPRLPDEAPPPDALRDAMGREYRFERLFETAPLSGLRWFLFRRAPPIPH